MPPTDDTPATGNSDALLDSLFGTVEDSAPQPATKEEGDQPERSRSLFEVLDDKTTPPEPEGDASKKKDAKESEAGKQAPDAKTTPPTDAPPKPEEKEEKQIRRRREPPPVAPVVPQAPAVIAPVALPPKPEVDPNAWEADLMAEEKDKLETARFAERKWPEKYKGLADKTAKFLKDHAAKVSAEGFDPQDPKYMDWVAKNNPTLPQSEVRMIDREWAKEEARRENEEANKDVHDEIFRRDQDPIIKSKADDYFRALAVENMPPEILEAFRDPQRGPKWAREHYALEVDVVEDLSRVAAEDVALMTKLTTYNSKTGRAVVPYDSKNPDHVRVIGLIRDTCEDYKKFAAANPTHRLRDGKPYVTRLEYSRLSPEDQAKVWTLTFPQIAHLNKAKVKAVIAETIKVKRAQIERYSKRPTAAASAAPPPPPPKNDVPPAPRPSAAPAATVDDKGASQSEKFISDSLFGSVIDEEAIANVKPPPFAGVR